MFVIGVPLEAGKKFKQQVKGKLRRKKTYMIKSSLRITLSGERGKGKDRGEKRENKFESCNNIRGIIISIDHRRSNFF